jgi:indole-3-glycerol phosphate synthase
MNAPHIIRPEAEIPDVLAKILADKMQEVRTRSEAVPLHEIERLAQAAPPPRPFIGALCETVSEGRVGLIAEIKKASPSGGLIRPEFDPPALAKEYQAGGATCLSVLTDAPYFQGRPEDLKAARAACGLPVLRKDFMVHPWQIHESRAMGADCILLIMAALTDELAEELEDLTHSLDMAVLLEVHDQRELDRALGMNSRLIGVNNRNLRTLVTDLATAEQLMPQVPADKIPIAESGIKTPEDVRRMAAAGSRCILVGESLMRQSDLTSATSALVHAL